MNAKRILALLGILVLVGIYVASFVFAFLDHPMKTSMMYASLYATRVVGAGVDAAVVIVEDVVLLGAAGCHTCEAFAVLESFDGIDAEHGSSQSSVQLVKGGLAKAYGTTLDDASDDATDGVALRLDFGNKGLHGCCLCRIGATDSIGLGEGEFVLVVVVLQSDVSHLRGVGLYADAQLTKGEFGQCSTYTACNGLAR